MEGKVFVKNVDGIEIYVNEKGTFEAEINGKIEKRASLSSLARVIKERRGGLDVQLVENRYNSKHRTPMTIIGFTENNKVRKSNGQRMNLYSGRLYLCDDREIAAIDMLIDEQHKLDNRWNLLLKSLSSVSVHTFDRIMKERAGDL